jgi:hypothetical protein
VVAWQSDTVRDRLLIKLGTDLGCFSPRSLAEAQPALVPDAQ